jgi:hypothetical protein
MNSYNVPVLNKPLIYFIAVYCKNNPANNEHFEKYMLDYSTFIEGITFASGTLDRTR